MSLFKFSIASAGNVVYAACSFAVAIVLARFTSQETLGVYALAQSICAPTFFLFGLGLVNAVATDAAGDFGVSEYLALKLVGIAVSFTAAIALGFGVSVEYPTFLAILAAVAVAHSADGVADIYVGYLRHRGHLGGIAILRCLNGIASLALMTSIISAGGSLLAAASGYAAGSVLALILTCALFKKRVSRSLHWGDLRSVSRRRLISLAARATPLGISGALSLANTHVPRYVLAASAGTTAVGLYAAAAQPMLIAALLVTSLSESVIGELSRAYHSRDTHHFRSLTRAVVISAVAIATIILASAFLFPEQILYSLYGGDYLAGAGAFLVLSVALAVRTVSAVAGTVLSARQRFDLNCWFKMPGTVLIAVSCLPLCLRYGLQGAAYSVLLGSLAEGAAAGYVLWTQPTFDESRRIALARVVQ